MIIWSLFVGSGLMVERAAEMGHKCNGFRMPEKKPVFVEKGYSKQYSRLGGKSARTKLIRSLTPRGFAIAVNEENLK